ncbi:MAG TPA: hypothetical protein PL065_19615 [Polyangiaceae bacterium]|nr:hypothetical protein [Polyangiaceae bacterium]
MDHSLKYLAVGIAASLLVFACSSDDNNKKSDDGTGGDSGSGGSIVQPGTGGGSPTGGSGGGSPTGGSGGGEPGGSGGGEPGGSGGGEPGGSGGAPTGGSGGAPTGGSGGGPSSGYGNLTKVSFSSGFIFDESKLNDQSYLQAHMSGIQMTPAFTGSYTSANAAIPPGGAQTLALAIHFAPNGLGVLQQSGQGQTVVAPMIQFMFASDVVASGPVDVGLEQTSGAMLLVMDPVGANDACVAAIGIGQVQVTQAQNTNAADGGQLAFNGSNIALYHPSDTPYGNIETELAQQIAVCPFK